MGACSVEVVPLRGAVSGAEDSTLEVLIRIVPEIQESNGPRSRLRLGIVVDRSGSMQGEKLEQAKEAARYVVDSLEAEDEMSLVTYDDQVATLAPMTPGSRKSDLHRAITSIRSGGQTALHDGWVQGGVTVAEQFAAGALNRVVLLSDGLANSGETRIDVIAGDVAGLADRGISTTTVGVGNDYNEALLSEMARRGGGNYWYIESPHQLSAIFDQELRGLAATFGHSAVLTIEPRTGVRVDAVLNNFPEAGEGMYRLPNLTSGVPVEAVIELKIEPSLLEASPGKEDDPGLRAILTARIDWKDTGSEAAAAGGELRLPVVSPAALAEYPENPDVRRRIILLKTASVKEESMNLVRNGEMDTAVNNMLLSVTELSQYRDEPLFRTEIESLTDLMKMVREGDFNRFDKHSLYEIHGRRSGHDAASLAQRMGGGPVLGDIVNPPRLFGMPVEAIVSSTDTHLMPGGLIARSIVRAAGIGMMKECREIGFCQTGKTVVTGGYGLPVPWVLHTVLPAASQDPDGRELAACYEECLREAARHHIRTIAIPALGTGGRGYPLELAARTAVRTVGHYLTGSHDVAGVIFVCYDEPAKDAYKQAFTELTGR